MPTTNAVAPPSTDPAAPRALFKPRHDNYIGGPCAAPRSRQYSAHPTPLTRTVPTPVARPTADDSAAPPAAAHPCYGDRG